MDVPGTPLERSIAVLAFAGILGGGVLGIEIARSIRDGDIMKTDRPHEEAGVVATVGGVILSGLLLNEASKEVGWQPLALGAVGVFGFAGLLSLLRR